METSPITPCYDVERLETKTHVGLGPGESIEYIKHRVSLEGHPWPGCRSEETPGVHIVMDRPSKEGFEQSWSSEPERLLLKQKGLCLALYWPSLKAVPNPAAEALQRQISMSAKKGLHRWRKEIWDAVASSGLYSQTLSHFGRLWRAA